MNKKTLLILSLSSLIIAGIFNNIQDTLAFKYNGSIFPQNETDTFFGGDRQYWQVLSPGKSYLNKYKDRDPSKGRAFIGSTTWLVFLTDGWHLAQFFVLTFIGIAIGLPFLYIFNLPYYYLFFPIAIVKFLYGLGWNIGNRFTED